MKEIIIKLDLMDIFSEVEEFGEDNIEVESVGKTLKEKIRSYGKTFRVCLKIL